MNKDFVERITKELKEALKQFGEYAYHDKGTFEIMELDKYISELKKMPAKEAGLTLKALLEHEVDCGQMVEDIILSLDTAPEAWYDETNDYCEGVKE